MRKLTKFDIQWNGLYGELLQFKKRYGHCDVPQYWKPNLPLGSWVIRQRQKARMGVLTIQRYRKLKKAGFSWNTFDEKWNSMYRKMVEYKKRYGHCDVSKYDKKNGKLAEWVSKQRRDKKHGEKRFNAFKMGLLESIGFKWSIYDKKGWEWFYAELLKFKKKYGHTRVKQTDKRYYSLANWVSVQRRDKRKLMQDRIAKLDAIGFIWKIKARRAN
jgi:hypothetical protein